MQSSGVSVVRDDDQLLHLASYPVHYHARLFSQVHHSQENYLYLPIFNAILQMKLSQSVAENNLIIIQTFILTLAH